MDSSRTISPRDLPAGWPMSAIPPARAGLAELAEEAEACFAHPVVGFLMNTLGPLVAVLDEHRQVLAINPALRTALGLSSSEPVLGRRPGELLGCQHVVEGPDGCGTSPACAYCGMVIAFLKTQAAGRPFKSECFLTMREQGRFEAREYEVSAAPLRVDDRTFFILVLQDISAAKRREALERIFYHDVANLVQGLQGWAELLAQGGGSPPELTHKLIHLTGLLARELNSHKAMAQAEQGVLHPAEQPVHPKLMLEEARDLVQRHPAAAGRHLRVEDPEEAPILLTDPELLNRVLANMAVNALEATAPGETVTLSARRQGALLRFQVHNPGEIPSAVRTRIFQRSFTTKLTKGHGLGTYAMKLFGEDVLGGRVAFDTGRSGTTFFIDLPLRPAEPKRAEAREAPQN